MSMDVVISGIIPLTQKYLTLFNQRLRNQFIQEWMEFQFSDCILRYTFLDKIYILTS